MVKTRTGTDELKIGSVRVDRPDRHASPQSDPPGHVASSQDPVTSLHSVTTPDRSCQLTSSRAQATTHVMSTLVRATGYNTTVHRAATVHPTIIQSSPARLTRIGHSTVSSVQCDMSSLHTSFLSDKPRQDLLSLDIATCHANTLHFAPQRLANSTFVKSPLGDSPLRHRPSPLRSLRQISPLSFRTAHSLATLQSPYWSAPSDNATSRHSLTSPSDVSHRLRSTRHTPLRQAGPAHHMTSRSDVPNYLPSFPHAATDYVHPEQSTATVHVRPEPVHSDRPHSTGTIPSDGPVQNGSLLFRATIQNNIWQFRTERPSRPGRHATTLHVSERQSTPHQVTSDHGDVSPHNVSAPSDYSSRSALRLSFATDRYGPRSWQPFATSHVCLPHLVTVPCDESCLHTPRSHLATSHSGSTFVPTKVRGLKCDKPSQAFLAPVLATSQARSPLVPVTSQALPPQLSATNHYDLHRIPATNRVRSTQTPATSLAPTDPDTSQRLASSIQPRVPATCQALPSQVSVMSRRLPKPSRYRSLRLPIPLHVGTIPRRLPMSRLVIPTRLPVTCPDFPCHGDMSCLVRSGLHTAISCYNTTLGTATAPAKLRPAPATSLDTLSHVPATAHERSLQC